MHGRRLRRAHRNTAAAATAAATTPVSRCFRRRGGKRTGRQPKPRRAIIPRLSQKRSRGKQLRTRGRITKGFKKAPFCIHRRQHMNLISKNALVLGHNRGKFAPTRLAGRRNSCRCRRHLSRMERQQAPEVPKNKQNKLLAKWSGVGSFLLRRKMQRTVGLAKRFPREVLVPARATLTQMVDGRTRGKQGAMCQTSSTIATHIEADPWVCSDKVLKAGQLPQQTGFRVLNGPRNLQGTQ